MNRLSLGLIPLMVAAGLGGGAVRADDDASAFDNRFYVAPMGSYTRADQSRGTDNGAGGTLAIGKRITKDLEVELLGNFTLYDTRQDDFSTPQPNTTRAFGAGVGANIYLFPSGRWYVNGLFVHADLMRGFVRGQPGPVNDYTTTLFDAGLGWDLPLPITLGGLIPPGLAIRAEALYHLDANNHSMIGTDVSEDRDQNNFTEVQFNIGLRIPIGGGVQPAPAPPPPEPPPAVVPVEEAPPPPPEAAPAPPPAPPPCQPPAAGQPISLEGCKTGDVIVLHGVNFDFNKATLTVNAKVLLDQVVAALQMRKDIKVEIDGYTDGKGSDAYNLKLSDRRAASVRHYLESHGIDAGRMSSKGFGKAMPVADNSTDEGREQNRRVELKVTESAAGAETAAPSAPAESAAPAAPADSVSPAAPLPAADGTAPAAPADNSTPPADSSTAAPANSAPAPSADSPAAPPADAAPAPATANATAP